MARLTDLDVSRVDYVKRGAVRDPLNPNDTQHLLLFKTEDGSEIMVDPVDKAEMSTDHRNNLPDDAFADPGNRKFPHHTASGSIDKSHLANALSRAGQNPNIDSKVKGHLENHAEQLGMGDRDTQKAESILHRIHKTLGDFFKADTGGSNASGMDSDAAQAIRGALDSIGPHLDNLPPEVRDQFDELAEAADYSPVETADETADESTAAAASTPNETPATAESTATTADSTATEPTQKGDEHMAELEKDKKQLTKEEELAKAMDTLPIPIRDMLKKQQDDLAAANERVAKAEVVAKAEREVRLKSEFIAKAENDFGFLPNVEYTGKVMKADGSGDEDFTGWAALAKSLSEKAPAEYAALEKALTNASNLIEKGALFNEMGSAAGVKAGGSNGISAVAKVEALANNIAKDEKGLSKEAAVAQALQTPEGRKLYKQYIEETEGTGRR